MIGKTYVIIDFNQNITHIHRVDLYIYDKLKASFDNEPYEWLWDETIFGFHTLNIVAYDKEGNKAMNKLDLWIFNIS